MRTIVQLSDLHFGTILEPTIEPVISTVKELRPDLVVISGDLTQRAREHQFEEARAFLLRLPTPQLVLPGNHDVPAYNLLRRFADPLGRYRRIITEDLAPSFIDDEIAVLGVNTARSMVIKGGRISRQQIESLEAALSGLGKNQAKIVVGHHPFDMPQHLSGVAIVMNAQHAMKAFARHQVDLFLGGHLHLVYIGSTIRYQVPDYRVPVIQSGTATSTRSRGEPNSFSVIRVDSPRITVAIHTWVAERGLFEVSATHEFTRHAPPASPRPPTPRNHPSSW
jgi:3',5'-cyclic AMP phosphodiesterase CpdA